MAASLKHEPAPDADGNAGHCSIELLGALIALPAEVRKKPSQSLQVSRRGLKSAKAWTLPRSALGKAC